jgi:hypothetical protein
MLNPTEVRECIDLKDFYKDKHFKKIKFTKVQKK